MYKLKTIKFTICLLVQSHSLIGIELILLLRVSFINLNDDFVKLVNMYNIILLCIIYML